MRDLPRPGPRCWHVPRWPAIDQAAWALGLAARDPFDGPAYASQLSAPTIGKVRKGYGRWLDFLDRHGLLDPACLPLDRVTRRRVVDYMRDLKAAGNADTTIIGRACELTMAMKILAPGADVNWIRRPTGPTIYALLPKPQRHVFVPDTAVLLSWAQGMMDAADFSAGGYSALLTYRDGLMIAIFASRGRRLRAMEGIRIGKEFVFREGRYWIDLPPSLVKTKKHDSFSLPGWLTPYMQRYLDTVRPAFMCGHVSDALWVYRGGQPLTAKGIQTRFTRLTKARFGIGFGPHRCRHAIATTAALADPGFPALGARMLGSSEQVIEAHYQRSGQISAARSFDALISRKIKAYVYESNVK